MTPHELLEKGRERIPEWKGVPDAVIVGRIEAEDECVRTWKHADELYEHFPPILSLEQIKELEDAYGAWFAAMRKLDGICGDWFPWMRRLPR